MYDQTFLAWGDPFESWVGRRIPALEAPLRHLEFNLVSLGAAVLLSICAWRLQPCEPLPRMHAPDAMGRGRVGNGRAGVPHTHAHPHRGGGRLAPTVDRVRLA